MYAARSRHLEQQTLPRHSERGPGAATVAILVAGAGWVHVLAIQDHWAHPHLAAFFIAVSVLQLGWACLVASDPTARLLLTGLAGNAGLLLLWGMSRTTGLSFVPDLGQREPVGSADLAASGLEFIAVIGLALMLTSATDRLPALAARPLVTATAAVTFLLVLTAGATSIHDHHDQDHHHDRHDTQFSPVGDHVQEGPMNTAFRNHGSGFIAPGSERSRDRHHEGERAGGNHAAR